MTFVDLFNDAAAKREWADETGDEAREVLRAIHGAIWRIVLDRDSPVEAERALRRSLGRSAKRLIGEVPGPWPPLALGMSGSFAAEPAATAKPAKPKAAPTKSKTTTTTRKSTAKPSANADAIAKAEAIIAEVDALPADQHVARVGDADVQRAFETVAAARGISME